MSIFLMGCYDPSSQKWCTVTKCSGGHDDATLARLQKELDMVKISKVRKEAAWPKPLDWTSSLRLAVLGGQQGLFTCVHREESSCLAVGEVLGLQRLGGPTLWRLACMPPGHTLSGQGGSHGVRGSFL